MTNRFIEELRLFREQGGIFLGQNKSKGDKAPLLSLLLGSSFFANIVSSFSSFSSSFSRFDSDSSNVDLSEMNIVRGSLYPFVLPNFQRILNRKNGHDF